MAQKLAFSPEIVASLQKKMQFIAPAIKAVSQFAKFPGPDGRYYADFVRIVASHDKKDGSLVVVFAFIVLANVEDGSIEYAGFPVRVRFALKAGPNSTEQDNWNRMYTDGYQAMGIATAAWTDPIPDMIAATEFLNANKFPVVLSIIQGKDPNFKNVNIQEVLNHEAVKHLKRPELSISDEAITEPVDDLGAPLLDETVDDFSNKFQAAEQWINAQEKEGVLGVIGAENIELDVEPTSLDLISLRRAVLANFCERAGKNPDDYLQPLVDSSQPPFEGDKKSATLDDDYEVLKLISIIEEGCRSYGLSAEDTKSLLQEMNLALVAGKPTAEVEVLMRSRLETLVGNKSIGTTLAEALDEEDDDLPEEDDDEDLSTKEKNRVFNLSRDVAKKELYALDNTVRFSKSMTDDTIRQMLLDKLYPPK